MNKNVFTKTDIVYKIGKKINNTIPRRLLDDIVNVITDFIYEEVCKNNVFTVNKFGNFYQGSRKPHLAWSSAQQKKVISKSKVTVKFSPHFTFTKLLKKKRNGIMEILKRQKHDEG